MTAEDPAEITIRVSLLAPLLFPQFLCQKKPIVFQFTGISRCGTPLKNQEGADPVIAPQLFWTA
jgi:hypothetical protein